MGILNISSKKTNFLYDNKSKQKTHISVHFANHSKLEPQIHYPISVLFKPQKINSLFTSLNTLKKSSDLQIQPK